MPLLECRVFAVLQCDHTEYATYAAAFGWRFYEDLYEATFVCHHGDEGVLRAKAQHLQDALKGDYLGEYETTILDIDSTPRVWTSLFSIEDCRDVLVTSMQNDTAFGLGSLGTGYEKIDLHKVNIPGMTPYIERCLRALSAAGFVDGEPAHYLLRMEEGAVLPFHTDSVKGGGLHVRVNVLIRPARDGGEFLYREQGGPSQTVSLSIGDAMIFRPDITEHAVSKVEQGTRLVLSVGLIQP